MRILQYLSGFRLEHGGPVQSVAHLSLGLSSLGHDVLLLSRDLTDVPPEWRDGDPGRPRAYQLRSPRRVTGRQPLDGSLLRLVAACDVVHIHSLWDLGAISVGRAAIRAGVPYVLSPRGSLDEWSLTQKTTKKRLFLAVVGRHLIENANLLHFTAEPEREQASRVARVSRAVVLANPIDLTEFETTTPIAPVRSDTAPTVLFLSRLHPKKGLEPLLDAASRLRAAGAELRIVIAGSGEPQYERSLRERCHRLGIEEIVEFLGDVRGERRASAYRSADLFVLPTSSENFGRVLFEALACGTAVLTTSGVDAIDQLLESGGAAIVDQDATRLAAEMERLLGNPQLLSEMGNSGSEWVRRELGHEVLASAYADAYTSVATPDHRARS